MAWKTSVTIHPGTSEVSNEKRSTRPASAGCQRHECQRRRRVRPVLDDRFSTHGVELQSAKSGRVGSRAAQTIAGVRTVTLRLPLGQRSAPPVRDPRYGRQRPAFGKEERPLFSLLGAREGCRTGASGRSRQTVVCRGERRFSVFLSSKNGSVGGEANRGAVRTGRLQRHLTLSGG